MSTTVTSIDLCLLSGPTPKQIEKKRKNSPMHARIMAALDSIKIKKE